MTKLSEKFTGKSMSVWKKLLFHLGLMAVVGCLLIWGALTWLDVWTDHGHYEVVPEVRGFSYIDAENRLREAGFDVEISDSIYDSKSRPGTVVEQNPKVNTKVKGGRMVYLTITATSAKHVTIPNLTDVSLRQARSILEGLGIKAISVVEVQSEFKDLVLGVSHNGVRLGPGARIPVTSRVTLEVGAGVSDIIDTAAVELDESMFDMDQLDIN